MTDNRHELENVRADVPPLLILTRFGLGVRDVAWLEHRATLISSITAPSLFAQDDQSFRWVLLVDEDLPSDVLAGLEKTLAPFGERALLHANGRFDTRHALSVARQAGTVGDRELVLTGLIDDDDAWNTSVVSTVRDRCSRWLRRGRLAPGLGITFEHGLEWVMYSMLDVDRLWKGGELERSATIRSYLFPFLGTSVFVLSPLSDRITAVSAGHSRMGEFLLGKGYDVDIVSTTRPMWLYCRHKQADSGIQKSRGEDLDISLSELANEFGIDEARTARYLASADEYGYSVVKRTWRYRRKFEAELLKVREQLNQPVTKKDEAGWLREREAELEKELVRVTEGVTGEFEDASMDPPIYEL